VAKGQSYEVVTSASLLTISKLMVKTIPKLPPKSDLATKNLPSVLSAILLIKQDFI
jgi:hypothetical protein